MLHLIYKWTSGTSSHNKRILLFSAKPSNKWNTLVAHLYCQSTSNLRRKQNGWWSREIRLKTCHTTQKDRETSKIGTGGMKNPFLTPYSVQVSLRCRHQWNQAPRNRRRRFASGPTAPACWPARQTTSRSPLSELSQGKRTVSHLWSGELRCSRPDRTPSAHRCSVACPDIRCSCQTWWLASPYPSSCHKCTLSWKWGCLVTVLGQPVASKSESLSGEAAPLVFCRTLPGLVWQAPHLCITKMYASWSQSAFTQIVVHHGMFN